MSQGSYQYNNCYGMLEEVRTELNEYSTALVQGSKVASYDNTDIVRKLNSAQRNIWGMLFDRFPELFLTSSSVSGSSGVYTIPSNLYRLCYIEDGYGRKINPMSVQIKTPPTTTGSPYLYYRKGNTVVRDNGASDALTFYYYKIVKDLTQGMSSAGGSGSLTLATTAKAIADYYNDVIIENITDGWSSTITDYTAARVATLTGTGAASKYYGTVSELPEVFHDLIVMKAVLTLKSTIVSPEKPTVANVSDYREALTEALRSFTGTYGGDVTMAELFNDFQPYFNR